MISALIFLVDGLLSLYIWIIIAAVILSWLVGFNVINPYSPAVRAIQLFCYRATEPLLAPIRRMLPDLGGLDISPVILILLVEAADILFIRTLQGRLLS
jgi:YggT family protein